MADPRFFKNKGPFTLGQLAEKTGATLSNTDAADQEVTDVATLDQACDARVSFFDNKKYLDQFLKTKAAAVFIHPDYEDRLPEGVAGFITTNPYKAYALAAQAFYPEHIENAQIHEKAVISETAEIGDNCDIAAGAVIADGVKIGPNTRIAANAVIGENVEIGNACDIGANTTISHAMIGDRVAIYPGAQIGQRGFGFAIDMATGFTTVPQLGRVIIGDDAEVGANSTIDRGAGPDTIIGRGTRIGNLVQLGHNVQIGDYCVMVSQSGVSGSSKVGNFVMIGGQAGIAGHLHLGDGAKIAGQSGVMRDVDPGVEVMGTPAVPIKQYMRQIALLAKMVKQKFK